MAELKSNIYIATEGGLSISRDGGRSYRLRTVSHGLSSNHCLSVSAKGNIVVVGTDNGISISRDYGESFISKKTTDGLPSNYCHKVYVSNNSTHILIITDYGAAITTDYGNTFKTLTVENGLLPSNICLSGYISNEHVFIGTELGLVYSNNNGTTTRTCHNSRIISIQKGLRSQYYYFASSTSVYRSTNLLPSSLIGPFYFGLKKGDSIKSMSVDEIGIIFVGTEHGLYYSNDNANTFKKKEIILDGNQIDVSIEDVESSRELQININDIINGYVLIDTDSWRYKHLDFDANVEEDNGTVLFSFQHKRTVPSWVDLLYRINTNETIYRVRMTKNNTVHNYSTVFEKGVNISFWFEFEGENGLESSEQEPYLYTTMGFSPLYEYKVEKKYYNKFKISFRVTNINIAITPITSINYYNEITNEFLPLTYDKGGWYSVDIDDTIKKDQLKFHFSYIIDGYNYITDSIVYIDTYEELQYTNSITTNLTDLITFNLSTSLSNLITAVTLNYRFDDDTTIKTLYMTRQSDNSFISSVGVDANINRTVTYNFIIYFGTQFYITPEYQEQIILFEPNYLIEHTINEENGLLQITFTPNNFTTDSVKIYFNNLIEMNISKNQDNTFTFIYTLAENTTFEYYFEFYVYNFKYVSTTMNGSFGTYRQKTLDEILFGNIITFGNADTRFDHEFVAGLAADEYEDIIVSDN